MAAKGWGRGWGVTADPTQNGLLLGMWAVAQATNIRALKGERERP